MKSRIQQKRTRRSQKTQKGGKPVTKSNIDKALASAQQCITELSNMMSNIEKDVSVNESQVKNARLATYELLTQLNIMESIIKKDMTPEVRMPASTSSYASSAQEPEDSWKTGPSDRSTMRDDYNSQFV